MTYIICCEDSERISGKIKIGDALYYLKVCQTEGAVYTNLRLKYSDTDEDNSDSEENQFDEEEYIDSDETLRKKYHNCKLSYYAGLVPAVLEPLEGGLLQTDSARPEVWLYVRPRFDSISIHYMLDAIKKDDENDKYFSTGISEAEKLISFGAESINLYDEIEIIYPEGKHTENNTDNKTIVEEIKNTVEAVDQLSLQKEKAFAINLSVLFECYARTWVKYRLENDEHLLGYKMESYVPNKKDLDDKSGYKNICVPHRSESVNIYLDGNIIPDIVLEKETNGKSEYIILDAKYKDPTGRQDRDDRLQLLAYAFMYDASEIGHIFPKSKRSSDTTKIFRVNVEKELFYKMYFID